MAGAGRGGSVQWRGNQVTTNGDGEGTKFIDDIIDVMVTLTILLIKREPTWNWAEAGGGPTVASKLTNELKKR
jgi:hypothetical protein